MSAVSYSAVVECFGRLAPSGRPCIFFGLTLSSGPSCPLSHTAQLRHALACGCRGNLAPSVCPACVRSWHGLSVPSCLLYHTAQLQHALTCVCIGSMASFGRPCTFYVLLCLLGPAARCFIQHSSCVQMHAVVVVLGTLRVILHILCAHIAVWAKLFAASCSAAVACFSMRLKWQPGTFSAVWVKPSAISCRASAAYCGMKLHWQHGCRTGCSLSSRVVPLSTRHANCVT